MSNDDFRALAKRLANRILNEGVGLIIHVCRGFIENLFPERRHYEMHHFKNEQFKALSSHDSQEFEHLEAELVLSKPVASVQCLNCLHLH